MLLTHPTPMNHFTRPLVVTLVTLLPLWAHAAFEACRDQFPNHRVPSIQTAGLQARALCFDSFAVLHSGTHKTPVYTVERLSRARLSAAKNQQRTNRFYEEARLPSHERARLVDYKGSGFDRGHMAPAGDMPNPNAMAQSFSLANMVPQASQHNQRLWNKIEQDTRKYVMRAEGDVFVFTGPWYIGEARSIGPGGVRVPDIIWKQVYDATTGKSWVHWSRNQDGETPQLPITLQEFTQRTGMVLVSP